MSEYDSRAVTERYGRTPKSRTQGLNYLKALKLIIAADGEIATAEWQALQKGMQRMGVSADVVETMTQFDPASSSLEELLADMKKGGKRARMLVRDAIELSRADGVYAAAEKAAVRRCADLLGVDAATVKALESLVEMEHAVKRLRKALL